MIQRQCPRFHLYHAPAGPDPGCPVCAAQQAELAKTRGVWSDADPNATMPLDAAALPAGGEPTWPAAPRGAAAAAAPPQTGPSGGRTVGIYAHLGTAVEPVVGWVACIEGPDRGRDWRLVGGRNAIGRGEDMPVRLAGDPAVSRERHAVISFDPRKRSFTVAPGDGAALVYCNGDEVVVPRPLLPYDRIELGASTLVFVPLVGESFAWGA